MRRIFASIAAVLIVASAAAQQTQHAALDRLRAVISDSCVTLRCSYSMYVSQTRIQAEADVMLQGNAFTVHGDGIEMYCDGTKVWTVDASRKEVYVEPVGNTDVTGLLDPVSVDVEYDREGNPVSAVLVLKDGLKAEIRIHSFAKTKIKPEDAFRPQVDFGSDWVVTEL